MSSHELLETFVGTWKVEAIFGPEIPIPDGVNAKTVFAWELSGAFLVQRSEIDHPDAPDSTSVITPVDGGFVQHYFDSRGVVRLYDMTFDGHVWTLTRTKPDFSSLDFSQRYVGTFSEDGRTIRGAWETRHEGEDWKKDFDLNYTRADEFRGPVSS